MNHVASVLGLPLPAFKAKEVVMQTQSLRCRRRDSRSALMFHRDSLVCLADLDNLTKGVDKADDDTVSTVCSSFDDTSLSGTVTFANPLVTAVYERPTTPVEDKANLYYTDEEYRSFRRDCFQRKTKPRAVKFSPGVVSNVWLYERKAEKETLYYSESDLQRFLDEFVVSLNETWS